MASRREDVDLWLVLTDPRCARKYIEGFNWGCPLAEVPDVFTTEHGRQVNLRQMSDEEAVVVAMDLLRNFEMNDVLAEFQLAEALGTVC